MSNATLARRHLSVRELLLNDAFDGGCTCTKKNALSQKRHLFLHGDSENAGPRPFGFTFWRCPHLEHFSNCSSSALKRQLLKQHLSLSDGIPQVEQLWTKCQSPNKIQRLTKCNSIPPLGSLPFSVCHLGCEKDSFWRFLQWIRMLKKMFASFRAAEAPLRVTPCQRGCVLTWMPKLLAISNPIH